MEEKYNEVMYRIYKWLYRVEVETNLLNNIAYANEDSYRDTLYSPIYLLNALTNGQIADDTYVASRCIIIHRTGV